MKIKISISIEQETHDNIKQITKDSRFRNKSHFIESAVESYLKNINEEIKLKK